VAWLPRLLAGGKVRITEIHDHRNPIFPEMSRPEPIPPNIDVLRERVPALDADVGIATDGDADRVGIVAETGRFVNQLEVFSLLAYYLLEVRGWRGPIVKTLSASSMLEKLGEIYGVPVYETGVGFKYVAPKMLETDAIIGGEESGGYAFRGHLPERDGILAGLMFLDFVLVGGFGVDANKRLGPTEPHLHLDFDAFDDDREAVIERALAAGVQRMITIGINRATCRRAVALAERYAPVYAAVGIHPNDATEWNDDAERELRDLAQHPKVVAIGEIGLDYYWKRVPRDVQVQVFRAQLAHNRECTSRP